MGRRNSKDLEQIAKKEICISLDQPALKKTFSERNKYWAMQTRTETPLCNAQVHWHALQQGCVRENPSEKSAFSSACFHSGRESVGSRMWKGGNAVIPPYRHKAKWKVHITGSTALEMEALSSKYWISLSPLDSPGTPSALAQSHSINSTH